MHTCQHWKVNCNKYFSGVCCFENGLLISCRGCYVCILTKQKEWPPMWQRWWGCLRRRRPRRLRGQCRAITSPTEGEVMSIVTIFLAIIVSLDWRQAAPGRYTEGAWFCSSASNLRRMLFPSNIQQTIEALAGGSAGAVGQTFSMIWSKIVPGRASANELHDEVR